MKKTFVVLLIVSMIVTMVTGCTRSIITSIPPSTTGTKTTTAITSASPNKTIGITTTQPVTSKIPPNTTTLVKNLIFPAYARWHGNKLWFSDTLANKIMAVNLDGKAETITEIEGQPAGLDWDSNGNFLVIAGTEKQLLRLESGSLTEIADLNGSASGICNEIAIDGLGRAYIGNFGLDTDFSQGTVGPAEIVMVTPDGKTSVVAENLVCPHGMAITPDGRTLILAEGYRRLLTFDIQADGSLSGSRVWATLEKGVYANGICLDTEGGVWVTNSGGNQVIRVLEGGEVTERINTNNPSYACVLGGPDLQTLFILTAGTEDADKARATTSGRIETVKVDVPGAEPPAIPAIPATPGASVFKVNGAYGCLDARPDSNSANEGIWKFESINPSFFMHGDIEGTYQGPMTAEMDTLTGVFTSRGEGTFTGTVDGKKGSFTFVLSGWGNFLSLTPTSGVGHYIISVVSGTGELAGLHGTIYETAQFTLKIDGIYSGTLSFEK